MAINRDKVYDDAMKLLAVKKYDKAIAELQRLLVDDAKDVRTLQKIAETYQTKLGKRKEAIDFYELVAGVYTEQGFILKAVAIYKTMLLIDPTMLDVHQRLAEGYQKLGFPTNALQHYEQVAVLYERAGNATQTRATLKRIVDLEPSNLLSRTKLAELYVQAGSLAEGVAELKAAYEFSKSQGRTDDLMRIGDRLALLDPADTAMLRMLASDLLERSEPKRALAKLEQAFRAAPRDVVILTMIAETFRKLDQPGKTTLVYKEVARFHEADGRTLDARQAWQRVLELSPGDADAETALGMRTAVPVAVAAAAVRNPDDEKIQLMLTETDVYVKYGLRDKAIAHLERVLAMQASHIVALDKLRGLLTHQQQHAAAAAALERLVVASRAAQHPKAEAWAAELKPASLLSKTATIEAPVVPPSNPFGPAPVSALGVAVPRSMTGLTSSPGTPRTETPAPVAVAAAIANDDLFILDDSVEVPALARRPSPAPQPPRTITPPPLLPRVGTPPPLPIDDDDMFDADAALADELLGAGAGATSFADLDLNQLASDAMRAHTPAPGVGGVLLSADELGELEAFIGEALSQPDGAPILETDDVLLAPVPAIGDGLSLDDDEEFIGAATVAYSPPYNPPYNPLAAPAPQLTTSFRSEALLGQAPVEDVVNKSVDLGFGGQLHGFEDDPANTFFPDELEECEFFLQQELYDEAREIIQQILDDLPESARAQHMLARLEAREQNRPEPPAPWEQRILAGLGDELADLPVAAPVDHQIPMEEVFSQFKKGIAETVPESDAATHYDLGIAYKEMGLLEDAIREFTVVARAPARCVDALYLVAIIQTELGRHDEAVATLQRTLVDHAALATTAQRAGLHYQLGVCLSALNRSAEALQSFQEAKGLGAVMPDLDQRLQSLQGGRRNVGYV